MMKILHTADWHLGKKLDSFSRLEEQILVINEIIEIAEQQEVDLVIIAGDLFDNFNPANEAIELFYASLKRLSNNGKRPVIAIAGNHDSPSLIDAPDPLARACGIILIGYPNAVVNPFKLPDFEISKSDHGFIELKLSQHDFPVRILHTPYANEARLKQYLGEEKEDELNTVLAKNWENIANKYCDEYGVNLLTAHLYMNKRGTSLIEEPDGEKPLKIGNADLIYTDAIPPQIQYTALGHLHGFQNIGTNEKPVVYASSPLCYSFSEAGQTKYVSIIHAQPNENVLFERIELTQGKALHRKSFEDINEAIAWLQENQNSLIELTLETDTFLKAEERKSLYQAHQGIVHLIPKVKNIENQISDYKIINLSKEREELFRDYFKSKFANQEPSDEIMDLFNEISKS